ncbi:hypothetical protein PTTG_12500 [Puccinia triticina 1-1 BBBD Race 1]|uniref:Retrotransposon gag domain-containing protein n=1 Tax=Puccinia triticina (isolate 1-1 / race 1 (BBBD)) TaxID=630390 RepID=A0A180GW43_PUCT1|nr:hypothetical protein PTTG_12500 [Puccinia triticina 1-1 BBBD Race 1]
MTTRNNNSDPLFPITDPEEILRTARRRARLDALAAANRLALAAATPLLNSPDRQVSAPSPLASTPGMQNTTTPTEPTASQGGTEGMSIADCLRVVIEIQQTNALQLQAAQQKAEEDRLQAAEQRRLDAEQRRLDAKKFVKQRRNDRERIRALEKATSVKQESSSATPDLEEGRIDLTRFKASDGPHFKGPVQQVKPFLTWMQGVSIFYSTKAVKHADDKRLILGALITNTNLLAFYTNESPKFEGKPWDEFKARLFEFCLPEDWRADIRRSIVQLKMLPSESFLEFSNRARTLQSLVNFETASFEDFDLAEFIALSLPHALQVKVREFQLLKKKPFNFGEFECRVNGFYVDMPRPRTIPSHSSSTLPPQDNGVLSPYLWRLFSYLDSIGKCHYCKTYCGNTAGACPRPLDQNKIHIAPSFSIPPQPTNYVAPRAWPNAQGPSSGKPTSPTAGRPTGRPAGVAGVSNKAPAFDQAGVLSVAMIKGQLEAKALDYGDDPLVYIRRDKEDSVPSNNEPTTTKAETLSLADIQVVHAATTDYPTSLLDFLDNPEDLPTTTEAQVCQDPLLTPVPINSASAQK